MDSGSANINVGDVVAYTNGNATEAGAVSGGTVTALASTTINGSTASGSSVATMLDSTHFAFAYFDGSPDQITIALGTVSGTNISVQTTHQIFSTSGTPLSFLSIATLDSSHFVVAFEDPNTGFLNAMIVNVSGTTYVGSGSETQLNSVSTNQSSVKVSALDATHFVVGYLNASSLKVSAVVASVSGTTISAGTPAAISTTNATIPITTALDSTHFAMAYKNTSTTFLDATVSSVSGTTITAGTQTNLNPSIPGGISIISPDSSHIVVAYSDSTNGVTGEIAASVSGTTITAGSTAALLSSGNGSILITSPDSSHVVVYSSTNSSNSVVTSVLSGTVLTAGTASTFPGSLGTEYSLSAVSPSLFILGYSPSGSIAAAYLLQTQDTTVIGVATNASSAGGTVTVASNGVVSGYSGLTAGSTYYWAPNGGATTTVGTYKLGLAISGTSILLNSGSGAGTNQFFGDAVFANDFRIAEGAGNPQSLVFKNQLGRNIATLDEDGNLNLTGQILASNINQNAYSLLGTTTFAELTTATTSAQTTATSTPPAWAGAFSDASDAMKTGLQSVLQSVGNGVVDVIGKVVYASVGIFDKVFAKEVHTDKLCVSKSNGTEVCVTGDQLSAVMNGTATSTPNGSNGGQSSGSGSNASSTPPTITLIGADPAQLNVGDTYIDPGVTVNSTVSPNIGYTVSLDGATSTSPEQLQVNTTEPGTHIILFSATDQNGQTGTATRTVIVVDPNATSSEATSTGQ